MAAQSIQFVSSHQPLVSPGDYKLDVTQKVQVAAEKIDETFEASQAFTVAGERFSLDPQHVRSVFPPAGSLGDHGHVLPQIVLERSTLPWERSDESHPSIPWLAVLLFDEQEKPDPKVMTIKELTEGGRFPSLGNIEIESSDHPEDRVTVIEVAPTLLQQILPSAADLGFLAHVRQSVDGTGSPATERAVVVGNRLPKRNGRSTAHLVSLEGRWAQGDFDYSHTAESGNIRLVSLRSWAFSCLSPEHDFKNMLLNVSASSLRLPGTTGDHSTDDYLDSGFVPLPHHLRVGGKTVSWYHGPLTPRRNATGRDTLATLDVNTADQLLCYAESVRMLDVSYSAAWQLGRMLALRDKSFAVGLFNWKRSRARNRMQKAQQAQYPHLIEEGAAAEDGLPPAIGEWLGRLRRLEGVPFNYLVPDERMLPPDSLRFFWLDWFWVESLLDGALSLGQMLASDSRRAETGASDPEIMGCLLRSAVVAGWPDLQVEVTGDQGETLPIVRMSRLSEDVLLCLFEARAKTVSFHLRPEGLHFGFGRVGDPAGASWERQLRDAAGKRLESVSFPPADVLRDPDKRVLDVESKLLAKLRNPANSAEFALQMLEGAERVSFSFSRS